MYAVVKTGGKQYRVEEKSIIDVNHLPAEVGSEIVLNEVLMLGGEGKVQIGSPVVSGAKVIGKVVRQFKGRKIVGFTYKPKKNVHRRFGHRQMMTQVAIERIESPK